ncbi:MAG: 50S ribosomal protein L6 [Candidatus Yonathbacteria bacterium]|nr:50S ribosomal protein L6 [Candidatus Yonathbacteria bacterium]
MSRIGKQIISIPEKTEVTKNDGVISVKGPLGELSRPFKDEIVVTISEKEVTLAPKEGGTASQALWGTYAAHIKNMIEGVNKKFEKKLIVEGIGYRAEISGDKVVFSLGFSHKITISIPKGISMTIEKTIITISGIDKELVGHFAASIRDLKKPEPYKGKGIRYEKEVIRRKEGKKSV